MGLSTSQRLTPKIFVLLNRPQGHAQEVGHLGMGPGETVNEQHNYSLPLRQIGQGGSQFGFEHRQLFGRRFGEQLRGSPVALGLGAAHPVEVGGRVFHRPNSVPMLPGIDERFLGRLTAHFRA